MLVLDRGNVGSVGMDAVDRVADLMQSLEIYVGDEFQDRSRESGRLGGNKLGGLKRMVKKEERGNL